MQEGLEEGVFLYPGGTGEYRAIICIGPAFTIGDDEVDLIVKATKAALTTVTQN